MKIFGDAFFEYKQGAMRKKIHSLILVFLSVICVWTGYELHCNFVTK